MTRSSGSGPVLLLLLAAIALPAAVAETAILRETGGRGKQPAFSWRTVPVFAETSNVSGAFDAEALETISRFSMFVAEKAYDYPAGGFAEDKLSALAPELRRRNPNITLVFYYNANLDLTDTRLYNLTAAHSPDWWLRDDGGGVFIAPIDSGAGATPPFPYNAHGGGVPVFDFTVPGVRSAWVEECLAMTSPAGGFDGCMVDRWHRLPFNPKYFPPGFSNATVATWSAARDVATAQLAARAKETGTYLVGLGDQCDASSVPGYGNGVRSGRSLKMQQALAATGGGLLASYIPGSNATTQVTFEDQLASFLIGAAPGHFFGAGSWTCDHTDREGVSWHPEYSRPLGPPLSNGTLIGKTWIRRFGFGTTVTFNAETGKGTIAWGSFPGDEPATVR